MVSVGTQTPWSWLSDQRICEAAGVAASTSADLHLPHLVCGAEEHREEERETEELSLPSIVPPPDRERDRERERAPEQQTTDLSSELRGNCGGGGEGGVSVPLSQLVLPSGSSSEGHTSEEEEGEEEEDYDITLTAPYPDLCVGQKSWPAILQYLRESESEASQYFSINRGGRRHREMKNDDQLSANDDGDIPTERETAPNGDMGPVVEGMSRECDFCGQPAAQWSMLHTATGGEEAEPCCRQFKEYCLLVAACLQQMIAERATAQPVEISVRLENKINVKTTAEEKAYALIRRRQRWEELQRKRKMKTLQSSSFYSLTKQTKTIQFSLLSPAVLNTGWMQGERSRRKEKEKKRGRRKKERKLPVGVLEMLKASAPMPRALEVSMYEGTADPFCTILPDHTGHYCYPSGSVAAQIYSHVPGLLSYLFYNDTGGGGGGSLLCYADELGRAFCYYHNSTLRLQVSASGEGVMYSVKGEVVRRWRWGGAVEGDQLPTFQPFSLSLNKQLVLQVTGREQLQFSLSLRNQHIKFTIPCKLKKNQLCTSDEQSLLSGHGDSYSQYLTHMQSQIRYLEVGLGSSRERGGRGLQLGGRAGQPRHRSRSTGTLTLTTHSFSSRRLV